MSKKYKKSSEIVYYQCLPNKILRIVDSWPITEQINNSEHFIVENYDLEKGKAISTQVLQEEKLRNYTKLSNKEKNNFLNKRQKLLKKSGNKLETSCIILT